MRGIAHIALRARHAPDALLRGLDELFDRAHARLCGDGALAALLLAPALTVLVVFGLVPLLGALYMSLFDYELLSAPFAGLGKYAQAVRDPDFWSSVRVTLYYVIGTVPATLLFSFLAAYALRRIAWGRGVLRTLFFLPYITSVVAAAMVWRALLNHPEGVANLIMRYAGLPPQQWLIEARGVLHLISGGWIGPEIGPSLALCCVILFDIWHGSGFMIVVFLAGLAAVPRELEEAARIDGAGPVQVVRKITLPLLSPTIFFLAVVGTIRAFQAFNSFYALTQRPDKALFRPTTNMILFIYEKLYQDHDLGYGAAVAALFTLAIVLLTVIQWRVVGKRVHYS
ncbi:MAG TPA: sugar ABC transporter permease [Candidatus Hydrogenedentes bacterium]|nr:sugar ABC transporter permease [Candidatus Hydrogenedentota bacterium]HNT89620.1 sugar ABC transporter permease [Candidatus Hydrogenedentota bacterium]